MPTIVDGSLGVTYPVTAGGTSAVQASSAKVLQVVNSVYSTETSTASTTYVDTGLTASITPTSATSKILVIVNLLGTGKSGNDVAKFRIVRGSTEICQAHDCFYTNSTAPNYVPVGMSTLDSPATTSSTTYKIQFGCNNGQTVTINANSRSNSNITLLEIAA